MRDRTHNFEFLPKPKPNPGESQNPKLYLIICITFSQTRKFHQIGCTLYNKDVFSEKRDFEVFLDAKQDFFNEHFEPHHKILHARARVAQIW